MVLDSQVVDDVHSFAGTLELLNRAETDELMAAIVVESICHYTVVGVYSDQPFQVIQDIAISDITGESRHDAIVNVANHMFTAWEDNLLTIMSNRAQITEIRWVDYDAIDGEVGSIAVTGTGETAGASMPGNVALRINKSASITRGARRGRMYLPGVAESWTDSTNINQITNATQAALQPVLDEYLDDINTEDAYGEVFGDFTAKLNVVHAPEGETPTKSEVTALVVQQRLASQRRRLTA